MPPITLFMLMASSVSEHQVQNTDILMMSLVAVGVLAWIFAEFRLYRRARVAMQRTDTVIQYWVLVAAVPVIVLGTIAISSVLPGDSWDAHVFLLFAGAALVAVVIVSRLLLERRARRSK